MDIRPPRRPDRDRAEKRQRIIEEYGRGASVFSDPVSLGALIGLPPAECREILEELVATGFLQRHQMNEDVTIYFRENDSGDSDPESGEGG